jgi:hypothetical protein
MKKWKIAGIVLLAVALAGAFLFVLMSHGDEPVAGVALADAPIADIGTLDAVVSGKDARASGFGGSLYATAHVEFGKYVDETVGGVPAGTPLHASVLFTASPKGIEYKAVWSRGGAAVKEDTKAITSETNREAVCYMLEEALVQPGEYEFAVYYRDKRLYTQLFTVE